MNRARVMIVGACLTTVAFFAMPVTVFAQDTAEPDATPVVTDEGGGEYILSPFMWKIIVGVLLPGVIGLVLKINLDAKAKGVISIVIAAIGALVVRWTTLEGDFLFDRAALQDIFHTYAIQLLTYLGIYRQFNINANLAPNFGIGPSDGPDG